MTNPKIAPWQAVFRTIDESGYTKKKQRKRLDLTCPKGLGNERA